MFLRHTIQSGCHQPRIKFKFVYLPQRRLGRLHTSLDHESCASEHRTSCPAGSPPQGKRRLQTAGQTALRTPEAILWINQREL